MKNKNDARKPAYPLVFWAEGETYAMLLFVIEVAKVFRGKWLRTARRNEAALDFAAKEGFKKWAEYLDSIEADVRNTLKTFPRPIRDMANKRAGEYLHGKAEASK